MLIILYVSSISLSAQEDVKINKKEFNNGKAGFSQAWEHISAGDAYYQRKGLHYNNAFDHYIQALAYNNSNAELNYKTGITAIYTDRKEEAAGFFLKALELKGTVAEDILLYTGRALQYSGNYSEAVEKLTAYLKTKAKKPENNVILAGRFIEECNAAIELISDTVSIEIINLGSNVNSGNDDFSPVITADGTTIYYSTQRNVGKSSGSQVIENPDENICFSRLINGKWGMTALAGEDINTSYNESPLCIDSSGNRLYIYSGYENGGDIKISVNRKGDWRKPESIPFSINTSRSETSFAFSPSGDAIYYVSDNEKDSKGGHDIFFITKLSDKKWSKPQNAGASINTEYDEQGVCFSLSGDTLWYSSKGHNSMGGFDLFYSTRNQDGTWKTAVNAGYPINTPWDELFHSVTLSEAGSFYFASNRSGGFGGFDIYKGTGVKKMNESNTNLQEPPVSDTIVKTDSAAADTVSDSTIVVPPADNNEPEQTGNPDPDDGNFSEQTGRFFLKEE